MAYQQGAGINVTEIDLTTIVPGVATSAGAISGVFRWGPVNERVLVESETQLVKRFQKPTSFNAETWFTAASFLGYSDSLYVVRAANTTGTSPIVTANIDAGSAAVDVGSTTNLQDGMILIASSNTSAIRTGTTITVTNASHVAIAATSDALANADAVSLQFVSNTTAFNAIANSGSVANLSNHIITSENAYDNLDGTFDTDVEWIARWPGDVGNSLKISVCDSVTAYQSNVSVSNTSYQTNTEFTVGSNNVVLTAGPVDITAVNTAIAETNLNSNTATLANDFSVGDLLKAGNTIIGHQYLKVTSITSVNAAIAANDATSVNVVSNTTLSTTSSAFADLSAGDYIVIYEDTDQFDIVEVASVTDGNNIVAVSNVSFSNGAADWAVYTPRTITFTTKDDYRLGQNYSSANTIQRSWEYFELFDVAPGTSEYVTNFGNTAAKDELHAVVVDEDGKFTGVPGTVVERYEALSRANDSKTIDGATNYYKTVINESSEYVWWANDRSTAVSNNALNIASSSSTAPYSKSFAYGQDGSNESSVAVGTLAIGYDKFASAEDVDIGLILQGKARGGTAGGQLANYLIDNVATIRDPKDCVVFISPDKADVVNNVGSEATDIIAFRNTLRSTSYGFLDSGYKQMYDRYNDVYRWIPLNGDTAGLAAQTEVTNDAWWSPAGFNRGNIKNIVKLAYNPRKSDRDILYKAGSNPIVTFPGQGTVLFGDKTLLAKPSAFDRINVRRLFIVLEKAISRSSKYTLFEFNDAFTRAQFRNLITPYLRDVQGRRGVTDFLVVCDETNNTAEVIDRNEFVGDIYIKPARSINYIQLNFVAVRTGVSFSEVVGSF